MSARSPASAALAPRAVAACSAQPADIPAKMPSVLSSSRVAASASAEETENRVVSTDSSYSSGTKPSSTLRSPYTSSPYRGSAATIFTPGTCSRRKRPVPISVPVVPRPATKWVISGRSASSSGPVVS